MPPYPEIIKLYKLLDTFHIKFEILGNSISNNSTLKLLRIRLSGNHFEIYVDDEYNDLNENNPALCLCLVLLELEEYKDEDDFLTWCRSKGLDTSNEVLRTYYMELGVIYNAIESIIGPISCPISSFDFELNAGAAQALRNQ